MFRAAFKAAFYCQRPGVDDATSPGLTDAAERDYFTLRERITIITKQLTGLQAYVREQCLK